MTYPDAVRSACKAVVTDTVAVLSAGTNSLLTLKIELQTVKSADH